MYSSNPNPPEQSNTGGLKLDGRTVALAVVVLLVLLFLGFQLFGNRGADSTAENQNQNTVQENPNAGEPASNPSLSNVVAASNVDREGCPADTGTSFDRSDTIYIGVINSDIPQGTDMFARLYYEGQPIEDTDLITADADYSCVAFAFEATNGAEVLESGSYEAQLFVNGNPGDSVSFDVR